MNRSKFGAVLLIALLIPGILGNLWAFRRYSFLAGELAGAENLVLQEDWEAASAALEDAQHLWRRCHGVTAALVDHEAVLRIDTLFRQLDFALRQQDRNGFGDLSAQLRQELEALAGEHFLSWENIL